MGMNAGRLDRRIQVERFTSEPGPLGGTIETWADLGAPIYASRRDVSDAERIAAGSYGGLLVTRFTIRASTFGRDIKRIDRLKHEGMTFEITGIKEIEPGKSFLEITAQTGDAE